MGQFERHCGAVFASSRRDPGDDVDMRPGLLIREAERKDGRIEGRERRPRLWRGCPWPERDMAGSVADLGCHGAGGEALAGPASPRRVRPRRCSDGVRSRRTVRVWFGAGRTARNQALVPRSMAPSERSSRTGSETWGEGSPVDRGRATPTTGHARSGPHNRRPAALVAERDDHGARRPPLDVGGHGDVRRAGLASPVRRRVAALTTARLVISMRRNGAKGLSGDLNHPRLRKSRDRPRMTNKEKRHPARKRGRDMTRSGASPS